MAADEDPENGTAGGQVLPDDDDSPEADEEILLKEAEIRNSLALLPEESRKSIQTPRIQIGYLSIGEDDYDPEIGTCDTIKLFFQAVGNLVIPRVKWSWEKEINSGGKERSILAFISVFLFTLTAGITFLVAFSKMDPFWGKADKTFQTLNGKEDYAIILGGSAVSVFLLLYIFDFAYGSRLHRIIGFILFFLAAMGISVAALFIAGIAGGAPLGVFLFWVPVMIGALKTFFFGNVNTAWYLLGVFIPLVIMSVVVMLLWMLWLYAFEQDWSFNSVKQEYIISVGCDAINVTQILAEAAIENKSAVFPTCKSAFIVWAAPPFLSVYCFIFANWTGYIINAITRSKSAKIGLAPMKEIQKQSKERFLQFLIVLFVFGIFATWITASLLTDEFISGAEDTVVFVSIETVVIAFLIYVATFGTKNIKKSLITSPLGIKLVAFSESDWASAVFLFLFTPFLVLYLGLSVMTQFIRRHTFFGKTLESEEEKRLTFKMESQFVIKWLQGMELGSVIYKVIWIGIFWFIAIVGIGRLANVFLSWLNEILNRYTLLEASLIITAAGVGMFALPPMPGLPIYLTVGLVISRSAELEGFSFAAAGWYSVAIGSLIKMLAICMQTKLIGTWMGSRSAYVRSVCQVNSVELRAMRKIMEVPGWTVPKVAVLVGGPDWPTSVLTGIMRLKLRQMLLGSLPVLVTIVPVSFAGAALLKDDGEGIFSTLAPLLLSIGVVVQLTPFFIAIHYIAKAAVENEEELANEELDEEVEKYDQTNEKKRQWSYILNKWENLSNFVKFTHVLVAVIGTVGNLTLFAKGDLAFETFDVTDTIEDKLGGNVGNLLKNPFGYIFLGCVGLPMVYVWIFGFVQGRRIKYRLANNTELDETDLPRITDLRFSSLKQFTTQVKVERLNALRARLRRFSNSSGRPSLRRSIGRLARRSNRRSSSARRSNRRSNDRESNLDEVRIAQLDNAENAAENKNLALRSDLVSGGVNVDNMI